IEIIIGADLYSSVLLPGLRSGSADRPAAQNSIFGWIISGTISTNSSSSVCHMSVHHTILNANLDDKIRRFWEVERLPSKSDIATEYRKFLLEYENLGHIAFRVISASSFKESSMWWQGPEWLTSSQWPDVNRQQDFETSLEECSNVFVQTLYSESEWDLLLATIENDQNEQENRITKQRSPGNETSSIPPDVVAVDEYQNERTFWLSFIQQNLFRDDCDDVVRLQNSSTVAKTSTLISLNPFLDENDLLHVGGRLRKLKFSYNVKYRLLCKQQEMIHNYAASCRATESVSTSYLLPLLTFLWEAGVRSVKYHLKRVIGSHTLTFEELMTLLCQIEACLNSRPIAPMSDNLDDYSCLTPSHLLIGYAITATPVPTLLETKETRLTRWQLVKEKSEIIWKAWSNDYLHGLQQHSKWRVAQKLARVGRLVLLRDPLAPPCKWKLGRIIECHVGDDGLTRVVTVKTSISTYKRSIVKLCFLPVELNKAFT
ncbi:hypothetical protein ALC57_02032, partial [Trachymyrmex cornetzi]